MYDLSATVEHNGCKAAAFFDANPGDIWHSSLSVIHVVVAIMMAFNMGRSSLSIYRPRTINRDHSRYRVGLIYISPF